MALAKWIEHLSAHSSQKTPTRRENQEPVPLRAQVPGKERSQVEEVLEGKEIEDGNSSDPEGGGRGGVQRIIEEKHKYACIQKQNGVEVEDGRVEAVFG